MLETIGNRRIGSITLSDFFITNLWPGLLVWILLFISDYSLTITCARLYRKGVNEKIVFEGSYEITPYFQKDIDSLRLVSPRFLLVLVLNAGFIAGIWFLSRQSPQFPELYELILGIMILVQLKVHSCHLSNLFLFRGINKTGGASGRIEYSRGLLLRTSSASSLTFSGLYLVLFVFTQSWFIFGGVIGCLSLAIKHHRLARKWSATTSAAAASSDTAQGAVQAGMD